MKEDEIIQKQKDLLGDRMFYKARLIFNVEPEPEVNLSVKMAESVRDEMRAFCKKHGIQQQKFVTEAIKEVLSRIKLELEDTGPLEDARKIARGEN